MILRGKERRTQMKKGLFHHDSVSIEEGGRLAAFLNGEQEPVTPAAAYAEFTAGESEGAAAARQRMIDRHNRARSASAAEARESMIQRQGRRKR